ncbi:MAG: SAM-dependent methyltransferase [Myxococcota bacterium]|jgi:SAM-dependent methyltransferase
MKDAELQASWDDKAAAWNDWVGTDGDRNRQVNSDPVLHRLLGSPEGLDILDAGCGTGYLSVKLAAAGGRVVGVDLSPAMIAHARDNAASAGVSVRFLAQSLAALTRLPDASFDRAVSNYVLMDLPDLEGAMVELARVLRPGGFAVLVFLHPCFGPPGGPERLDDGSVRYRWPWPYLEQRRFEESWGPFNSAFIAFHRPLSAYFAAITQAGLTVAELHEPAGEDTTGLTPEQIRGVRMTPFSVVLKVLR